MKEEIKGSTFLWDNGIKGIKMRSFSDEGASPVDSQGLS